MWKDKKLGEIVNFKGGGTPSKQNTSFWNGNIPWASVKDIKGDYLETTESKITKDGVKNSSTKVCSAGDLILITRISPGKSIISKINCAINQDLKIVDVNGDIDKMFLHYFFKSQIKEIEKKASGTTVLGISLNELKQFAIPLPPLPTQNRIVEKIEELFSELDNGVENLKKAQKQLKTYRQAVLKDAFEGKLTKEWRALRQAQDADGLPTPEELLEQIKAERKAHRQRELAEWEKEVEQWKKDGKPGRKPRKPRKLDSPDKPNQEHEDRKWEIPMNWLWTQLGYLSFVTKLAGFEYTKYVEYDDDGDIPVIKAENAGKNGFKPTDFSFVKSETVSHLERSKIDGGELLVVFVGAGTGNVALVPKDKKYFLGPNIAMAKPYAKANMKYIEYFFQSHLGKNLMMAAMKAVAQPSLNMGTIRQAPLALPSLEEQQKIVNEIESRLSVVDQLEETINENLQKAEALRQSILKKAFGGELVS
jgi:type I restriction enzyme S subunit